MGDSSFLEGLCAEGRYRRVGALGSGAMGEVVLVHDDRIGREVAAKVMRDTELSEEDRGRFVREARIQARLEHPSLVPVYDMSDVSQPEERAWFTMRRVRGTTLAQILQRLGAGDDSTRFGRTRLLAIFVQVCRAIDYAHSRGVLHRDITPANIMVGEFGEVYVLDWGIAKLLGATKDGHATASDIPDDELSQTTEGSALGTPGYMAPEQALGELDVTPAADVYALGCILFEILTYARINTGDATRERISQTIEGVDARIGKRFPDREISPELEALCVAATHYDPTKRIQSAGQLADRLEEFLEGDRDMERRQRLAFRHVRNAHAALAEGGAGRSEATRELARALALDPENAGAAAELAQLLLEPPEALPPDAKIAFGRWVEQARQSAARATASRYLLWLAFVPLGAVTLGVRMPWHFTAVAICFLVASVCALLQARGVLRGVTTTVVGFSAAALGLVFFTPAFGPLVIIPPLLATNLMYHAAHVGRRQRVGLTLVSLGATLISFFGDRVGLWPSPFSVSEAGLVIHGGLVGMPPDATWWIMLVVHVLVATVPALHAGGARDALVAAERRLVAHAWAVEQLVPESVRRRYDGSEGVISDTGV
ncbi:MAG: serine/threonine protein kinase [Myxococcales bacterium]|nr:serine/threonine protein kinase [Myxococcales bacterium]